MLFLRAPVWRRPLQPKETIPKTRTGVSLILRLLLVSLTVAMASFTIQAQGAALASPSQQGLFGQVTDITTPSSGLTVITLETTEGLKRVHATEFTVVTIPGAATASASQISPGDFLAVLVEEEEVLQAERILVKPESPVIHAHITGAVVGAVGDQLSIMDGNGNVITADLLLERTGIAPAEVITAVVSRDPRSGGLSILAVESAQQKIQRLRNSLERAITLGARNNEVNLKARLAANTTGLLTTLNEIRNRVDPGVRVFYDQVVQSFLQSHGNLLSAFDLGEPTVKLTGVVEDADLINGIVFVTPQEGPTLQLKLVDGTVFQVFGEVSPVGNLGGGQRIESFYNPQTGEAKIINVTFPTLGENLVSGLLRQAPIGELEGTVAAIDGPVVTVLLATGETVTLATTPETKIRVRQGPGELQDLVPLIRVKVRYEPATLEALDIDTFDVRPGRAFVAGAVKSIVRKIRPGIRMPGSSEDGNIAIISPDGEVITLNITENTIIERDGLRVNIAAVRLGDLVRPTSRYDTPTRDVQKLALKAPRLRGTVIGKLTSPSGTHYLTVSTDELAIVTIAVPDTAEIIRGGEGAGFGDIAVRDRIVSGLFDPRILVTSRLVVEPPKTLRVAGTISDLDKEFFILEVTPAEGVPIALLVPNKPGIITKDRDPRSIFDELRVGDRVLAAYYRPDRVVVRIFVSS